MDKYILLSMLFFLISAIGLAWYTLSLRLFTGIFFAILSIFGIVSLYWYSGAPSQWARYQQYRAAKVMLASVREPSELIDTLKRAVDRAPKSARGWYLLGRLYASQGRWKEAEEALHTAYTLAPDDVNVVVRYAESMWQTHHQSFNAVARAMLHDVLKANPRQTDALAMLAMDAYVRNDCKEALYLWRRLLALLPAADSDDINAVQTMIVRCEGSVL